MKIAIFGQYYKNDTRPIIKDIFVFFNRNQVELIIEADFLKILYEEQILEKPYKTFASHEDLDNSIDLLVSIGGDGTILRAVTFVRDKEIPILGINAGRLGFLAKVQKDNIDSFLQLVLEKKYTFSRRSLVALELASPQETPEINFALNEIAISRKDTTSMITIDTFLDGEFLTSYWADGLIIASPTGSTGYSLSCGGPILIPQVNSFVITPIAPHNLNARPLVIPDTTEIRLRVSGRESHYLISLDSRIISVANETELLVKRSSFDIKMVETASETFLTTLRNKLLFGADKRN